jgi:hypothetical protein
MYIAEPLVPESSAFEVEMAIGKLKRYKSPGTDQIPAELIKAGGSKICSEIQMVSAQRCGHTQEWLNRRSDVNLRKAQVSVPS